MTSKKKKAKIFQNFSFFPILVNSRSMNHRPHREKKWFKQNSWIKKTEASFFSVKGRNMTFFVEKTFKNHEILLRIRWIWLLWRNFKRGFLMIRTIEKFTLFCKKRLCSCEHKTKSFGCKKKFKEKTGKTRGISFQWRKRKKKF